MTAEFSSLSRRTFLEGSAAASLAFALPSAAAAQAARPGTEWLFFGREEAAFIEAAIDRLIPSEAEWPGARQAGVARYIDLQLAGPFGQGDRLFLGGPFLPGTPSQGYQLPHTPAALYRRALRALLAKDGAGFERLSDEAKDALLTRLEIGEIDLDGVPSSVFFETLLTNTIEGYFADPVYGGNVDMVSWRMIGFPGAHAAYLGVYQRHGERYDHPPLSLADTTHAHHSHGPGHAPAPRGR